MSGDSNRNNRDGDLKKAYATNQNELFVPIRSSKSKSLEVKSKIPIRVGRNKISPILNKQSPKSSTITDLVLYVPEYAALNSIEYYQYLEKVADASQTAYKNKEDIARREKCTKKVLNPQELFKIRVPRATTKSEYVSRNCKYHFVSKPRSNVPLVVIDFDSLTPKLTKECFTCHKLTICDLFEDLYPMFNIGFWSSMRMTEFLEYLKDYNLLDHCLFSICFCLDSTSLITAFVPSVGMTKVKALEIVWNLYPQFHRNNSVMFDENLKKIIFKHYNIVSDPMKETKYIKECQINLFLEYLFDFYRTGQPFSKLNMPQWKLSWNEKL